MQRALSHAVISQVVDSTGGASQLASVLQLFKDLCSASQGPSKLVALLQTVMGLMEKAGGDDKV